MEKKQHPGPFDLKGECPVPPQKQRRPMIWTSEKLKEREFDHENIPSRIDRYEQGLPIITQEVLLTSYLESLSHHERKALIQIYEAIFRQGGLNKGFSLMGLAVGSTTFPDSYWRGLEIYLRKEDPEKRGYALRRGEDIDLKLCFETGSPGAEDLENHNRCIRRGLDRANIIYQEQEGRENGTSYLTVPLAHRKGEGVLRQKDHEYEGTNFIITLPKSRPIHVSLSNEGCSANDKLLTERVTGAPFCLLFRHSNWYGLRDTIKRLESQLDFFRE